MKYGNTIMVFLLGAALAGCAVGAADTETELEDGSAPAPETTASMNEEPVGAALGAQCAPGSVWVSAVSACITVPMRVDRTPGAFGCDRGGVMSARGSVICFPPPRPVYPPPIRPIHAPSPVR
ncbi:hypothetical protein [Sorangium sp. So ce233]|uniref:hypothetical protein n=1 Tax=Sorangium sp. So ce233 TaxID=3133290 RepID=UPI003F620E5D